MYGLVRKALFSTPPELAHELALESLQLAHRFGTSRLLARRREFPVSVMGLEFSNPVGLAAGMDKNGDYIDALGDLGFGFIEIGTVTPRPQPGNPKPRVFRLPQAEAMINRLGFNNKGVDHLVLKAQQRRFEGILGINIGKNFYTPNERAVDDYLHCLDRVHAHADYITVNISSPNTKGLRELQGGEELDRLLAALSGRREQLADQQGRQVPMAVKVAPDLKRAELPIIADAIARHHMDAVIATNTTVTRGGVEGLKHADEGGGLSGRPVFKKSNQILKDLRALLPAEVAMIGVGGILDGQAAAEKIRLGADLVQFYTGFVYRGPDLVGEAVDAIGSRAGPA